MIRRSGRVTVSEVATSLAVTTETVRRDLGLLERGGLLRRVHGGAVPTSALTVVEPGLAERDATNAGLKDRIARAAQHLVPPPGGSVLLDAGTTTSRLAALLRPDSDLVVVTGAVPIASRLAGFGSVQVHLLGGQVRGRTQAAVGQDAVRALADLHVDVAFLGANAVSVEHGATTPHPAEAEVKRAMVASGRRVVVLADSTKLGHVHLVRFAGLDAIDVLVTDDGIADADVTALEAREIDVVVA